MTWINAIGYSGLALLGISAVTILLLYFLKLRRRPLQVPSTMLWKKTLEDMHVNSLWQRLRNNLLLWLQLLAVLLLLLAGLRPGCRGDRLPDHRHVFVVDVSASMAARDLGDRTRLEEAKQQLLAMIDRMTPARFGEQGDMGMIIAFDDRAETIQSFTDDIGLLKRQVARIRQTDRRSDIREALLAASALANPGRASTEAGDTQVARPLPATMTIFSDGGVRGVQDFDMGYLEPVYRAIGAVDTPRNCAVTAFSMDETLVGTAQRQVYAQIYNGTSDEQLVDIDLFANDELFDSQAGVKIPGDRTTGISFDVSALLEKVQDPVELRLEIRTEDVLDVDNIARLIINPPAPSRVLCVSSGNDYLRLALSTSDIKRLVEVEFHSPDYVESDEYVQRAALGYYSMAIFEGIAPRQMPACSTILIDALPPGEAWKMGQTRFPTSIVDIDQSHPVMVSLQLSGLLIVEGRSLSGPGGSQMLLESTYGPVMMIGPREGFQDLVIGFPMFSRDAEGGNTVNTNWPSQLSFPLFIQNAVSWMTGESNAVGAAGVRPGDTIRFRAPVGATGFSVVSPAGERFSSRIGEDGFAQYSQTDQVGVYTIEWAGAEPVSQRFAVNLLDVNESTLRVRDAMELGYEKVAASYSREYVRREFWPWVAALALVVLMIEWYVYNRRVLI